MKPTLHSLRGSPAWARVAPFLIVVVLTACQTLDLLGPAARYWLYALKTVAGALLIWAVWPVVEELRWRVSWSAVAAGIGVFVVWVGLDPLLRQLGLPASFSKLGVGGGAWTPLAHYGEGAVIGWGFVVVRIAGATLVVPMVEELFYRSFLYRFLTKADFLSVPLGRFSAVPFVATCAVFGLAHREWLAGIVCGLAYQGLVCRKGRLGDAMTAHAITNFLLGLWVVWRGAWEYW